VPIILHTCAKTNQSTEFQDQKYGKGRRVANPVDKSLVNGVHHRYRCAVCGETVGRELLFKGKVSE
jgi:hypothetical protein